MTDAGMVRTIVFIGNDAKQIPVLTNLDASFQPAKVIHCLKLRWRQENSFKYLSEHYGVEQIIQYGADVEKDPRKVPNPKRKALKQKLQAVSHGSRSTRGRTGTCSGPKRGDQTSNSSRVEDRPQSPSTSPGGEAQVLTRLHNRLQHTPALIAATDVDKTRSLLREDRRLIVNAIKLAAYNSERLLALGFFGSRFGLSLEKGAAWRLPCAP